MSVVSYQGLANADPTRMYESPIWRGKFQDIILQALESIHGTNPQNIRVLDICGGNSELFPILCGLRLMLSKVDSTQEQRIPDLQYINIDADTAMVNSSTEAIQSIIDHFRESNQRIHVSEKDTASTINATIGIDNLSDIRELNNQNLIVVSNGIMYSPEAIMELIRSKLSTAGRCVINFSIDPHTDTNELDFGLYTKKKVVKTLNGSDFTMTECTFNQNSELAGFNELGTQTHFQCVADVKRFIESHGFEILESEQINHTVNQKKYWGFVLQKQTAQYTT